MEGRNSTIDSFKTRLYEDATSQDTTEMDPLLVPLSAVAVPPPSNEDLDIQTSNVTDHQLFNELADIYSEAMNGTC